jgi:UDP-N-acetylbacillosamine N-acetyltransferase
MGKTSLAIYGASGHGKVVFQIAKSLGYEEIFYIDDGENAYPNFDAFLTEHGRDTPIALAIGDNDTREKIFNTLKHSGCIIQTLVDSSALISSDVTIAEGTIVMPGVIINSEAKIGEGVILNSACVIEHECEIASFSHISPHVSLAGGVKVGAKSHIGIGACVIQGISIGESTIVGAGSVVINDVENASVVVGNPAKKIKEVDA